MSVLYGKRRRRRLPDAFGGRFRLVLIAALLTLSACQRAPQAPSVILILIDTLRADYLGVYGFKGPVSPHLDAFANESVLFERCFSQAPWTKPSIASLFTSLQPAVHRVFSHNGSFGARDEPPKTEILSEDAFTLAEALRAGGYATGAFVANPWIRQVHGFGQGFDLFDSHSASNGTDADPVLKAASDWMSEVPPEHSYFAYIHLMDVHGPYEAPDEDFEAVRDSPSLGTEPLPLTSQQIRRVPRYLRRSPWVTAGAGDVRIWRGHYAAGVRAADVRIGAFIDDLREKGILDHAIIVITADHGEQLYEHRHWDHGFSLYDEELHVPLIIHLPGGRGGGRRIGTQVSLIDVMPTIIQMTGVGSVEGMQGRDLSQSFDGIDDELASASSFAAAVKWKPTLQSARTERYKLIQKDGKRPELYDLRDDPGEKRNIAASSPALGEMEALLTAQDARNKARGTLRSGAIDLPAKVRERLRALGYEDKPLPEATSPTTKPAK